MQPKITIAEKALHAYDNPGEGTLDEIASEFTPGFKTDQSIILHADDRYVFAWPDVKNPAHWIAHSRLAIHPTDGWHTPMYRWPNPMSILVRTLSRLQDQAVHTLSGRGYDLDYDGGDPDAPLVGPQQAIAAVPSLLEKAAEAMNHNQNGDYQLSALDEAESWACDDLEKILEGQPILQEMIENVLLNNYPCAVPAAAD